MAKKNKSNQVSNKETIINDKEPKATSTKEGYRIKLKTKNSIIIDKYGINVKIKLSMQELVKYQVGDLYYL